MLHHLTLHIHPPSMWLFQLTSTMMVIKSSFNSIAQYQPLLIGGQIFSIPSYPSHVGNQIDSVLFSAKCPLSFKPVGLCQSNGGVSWVVKSQEKCTLFDCWLLFKPCLCGLVQGLGLGFIVHRNWASYNSFKRRTWKLVHGQRSCVCP